MEAIKVIAGNTEEEIWQQVASDLAGQDVLEYHAMLQPMGKPIILLEVEIDLGGGFEGGYELTRLSVSVSVQMISVLPCTTKVFWIKQENYWGWKTK